MTTVTVIFPHSAVANNHFEKEKGKTQPSMQYLFLCFETMQFWTLVLKAIIIDELII